MFDGESNDELDDDGDDKLLISSGSFSIVPYRKHMIDSVTIKYDISDPNPNHVNSVSSENMDDMNDDKHIVNMVAYVVVPFWLS